MNFAVDHIAGQTFHGRKGEIENAFKYSIDYVLLDAEARGRGPFGFGRNRAGLAAIHDRDHGGAPHEGRGAAWARDVLAAHGLDGVTDGRLELLAQPRILGHVFNPVSFWLAHDADGRLTVVIAEVTNTFGDRHSYLCYRDDRAPIERTDTLTATKIFHVSPFQPIEGGYSFRFDITDQRIGIWIDYSGGQGDLAQCRAHLAAIQAMNDQPARFGEQHRIDRDQAINTNLLIAGSNRRNGQLNIKANGGDNFCSGGGYDRVGPRIFKLAQITCIKMQTSVD